MALFFYKKNKKFISFPAVSSCQPWTNSAIIRILFHNRGIVDIF